MDRSLWGLCFFDECSELIVNYFDSSVNTKFQDYANTIGIKNFTNYNKKYYTNTSLTQTTASKSSNYTSNTENLDDIKNIKEEIVTDTTSNTFKLLFYFTFVILLFQLLTSLFGHFIFDEEEKDTKDAKESPREARFSQNGEAYSSNEKTSIDRSDRFYQPNRSIIEKLYKFVSIHGYFRRLTQIKNKYFNDTDLEILCGIKTILLFIYTFLQLNVTISQLPRRNTGNYYYSNWTFSLVKFSSYSLESIICINGIICSFKLMNIYKKEKQIKFTTILKFFAGSLSKVILFHYIFFVFYYFMTDIGKLFNFNCMVDFFMKHYIEPKVCFTNFFTSYIPFYYQYGVSSTDELDFSACFKYFQLLYCEFCCFVITLMIFFFISRFKSNVFDNIFSISVLVVTVLSYFIYVNIDKLNCQNVYSLNIILGETRIFKQSHMLYYVYFIGVNCGIIHFYFKDMVSSNPMQATTGQKQYLPFKYNLSIMNFFYKTSGFLKFLFIILLLGIIIFFSVSYNVFLSFTTYVRHNNLLIEMNQALYIFYIFEKKIYILSFACLVLVLLINTKNNLLKSLFSCQICLIISRISFCYICLVESFTYLFYSFNEMQTYLNIESLLYITIALFFLIILSSMLMVMIYEMPLRMGIKRLLLKSKKEKKESHTSPLLKSKN